MIAAAALMGQSGAVAMLILLFLAVTSACSAEQIAVSSLLTYDVYGTYINKSPTEKQILRTSQYCIFGYSIFMGAIATGFYYIGVSMGYLYELMGTMIGSAVVPIALCITWKKTNGTGAVLGAIAGFCAGVAGWIGITSSLNDGVINVETTFGDYEMLTGNLLAIGVGGIITVGWSLARPANFDWDLTRAINIAHSHIDESLSENSPEVDKDEKRVSESAPVPVVDSDDLEVHASAFAVEQQALQKSFRFASLCAITLTLILLIAIPLPLFFSSHGMPLFASTHALTNLQSILWADSLLGSASALSGSLSVCFWSAFIQRGRQGLVSLACSVVFSPISSTESDSNI